MDLILANPAGLWMLLGVPAVLAIHFLQSRSQRIEISTLFLLNHIPEEERSGAVFQQLRQSLLLWFQLLAILLATLLMTQPLFLRPDSVQSIAWVLDASHAMQVYHPNAIEEIDRESRRLARATTQTEWYALSSDPTRPTIYSGDNRADLMEALRAWQPDSGEHDAQPALSRARDLVGAQGLVAWVTYHIPETLPPDAGLLAVGYPVDNAGFGGAQISHAPDGSLRWRALLMNYSDVLQERQLTVEISGEASRPDSVTLEPDQFRVLQGSAPSGTERLRLILDPDAFSLDDILHIVPPRRRPIAIAYALPDGPRLQWAERVPATIADAHPATGPDTAHLVWRMDTIDPARSGLVWSSVPDGMTGELGDILASDHPLTRDLVWHDLMTPVLPGPDPAPGEHVLLWMNEHPLILLREQGGVRHLLLRFDLTASNADRSPAMILLVHRFIESVRSSLPGAESDLVELNQPLSLAVQPNAGPLTRSTEGPVPVMEQRSSAAPMTAPSMPGFFRVTQGDTLLFEGAAFFADTRQADFRDAASRNDLDELAAERSRRMRRDDPLAPVWLALLGLTIGAGWYVATHGRTR